MGCWFAWTIVPPSDGSIFQHFLQNSSHNYFHYFYNFEFFHNLKKVKSNYLSTLWNALRPRHWPTVLFPMYQIIIGPSDGGTIIQANQQPIILEIDWIVLASSHFVLSLERLLYRIIVIETRACLRSPRK